VGFRAKLAIPAVSKQVHCEIFAHLFCDRVRPACSPFLFTIEVLAMPYVRKSLLIAFVFLQFFLHVSAAPTQGYTATVAQKFGSGLINIATGIVELPRTMIVSTKNDGPALGLTGGLFKGLANTLGRIGLGTVDLISFPIPTKPLMSPAMVWQDFDQETTFNNTWELYNTR
jgi:putative exosortase-associated protein (TIGR04073 family)